MRNIYRLFTVTLVALVFALNAFTQKAFCSGHEITVNASDSVVIRLNDYEGTIQWQKSFNNNEWENISGAVYDTLLFIADATTYFRAEVIAGFCDPFFSDIVKVIVITGQPDQGVVDIDGNFYPSVIIGNQEWMAENLKTTKYRNGTPIDYPGSNNSDWENNTTGAYAWYQNIPTWKDKYGALYNWHAVNNSNGLCPLGWHVPTDEDWNELLKYLETQGYPNDNIVSGAGNALKSCRQENSPLGGDCNTTEHPRWNSIYDHYGFDQFGFSALPGSSRSSTGYMGNLGYEGNWWSSTEYLYNNSKYVNIEYSTGKLDQGITSISSGRSVRCIRYVGSLLPPTLSTLPVSEITAYTAVSGGNIMDDGGSAIIERGVVWSTSQNPTIENNQGITHDGSGVGSFSSYLTELIPKSLYYLRAYATNNYFTSYGSQVVFVALSDTEIVFGNGVTDIDDNFYPSVIIGNQEWMAENLRVTRDENGNNVTRYCYDNNPANCDIYGGLYTWVTMMDGARSSNSNPSKVQGICPTGWHVPSNAEWRELVNYLVAQGYPNDPHNPNGAGNALKSCRQVSSPLGGDCDTSEHPRWNSNSVHYGREDFGFSALPGGYRSIYSTYQFMGTSGYWWSSTEYFDSAIRWSSGNSSGSVGSYDDSFKNNGFSVRCIRDSGIPILTSTTVSDITPTSAVSGGNVSDDSGNQVLSRGVVWSTTPNPTLRNNNGYTSDGSGLGEFTSNLTGLLPETTYYVKAYATNSAGTGYGQLESFTTISTSIPTLTTTAVEFITLTSAVSGGNISDDGGAQVLARGVVWSITPNPTIENKEGYTSDGTGLGEFTSNLTGLIPSTIYYVRAYATNSAGTGYGQLEEFTTEDIGGNIQPGQGVTDIDGNFYSTVIIGNQEWMAENLLVTRDSNGNDIIRYCYDNDAANCNLYGGLYTWYTVMNGANSSNTNPSNVQGICPTGWHVPSDAEWTELVDYIVAQGFSNSNVLNGAGNALKSCRQVSSPLGGYCAISEHPRWDPNNTHYGSDEFGFSALPGGYCGPSGSGFYTIGSYGSWWSSAEDWSSSAWHRYLYYENGSMNHSSLIKDLGFSVRCVRDPDSALPTISTLPVTNVTSTTAQSGGNIANDGNAPVTSRGVVWSTLQNPTIENNQGFSIDGTGAGSFTSNLTGLIPETTYYVRAYVTNSAGTGYGQQETFSTDPSGMNGSFNNPFTVAYAIANNEGSGVWVQGYITGVMETNVNPFEPNFVAPFSTSTNIIIADSPGESNLGNSLIIQLPAGAVREALNLVNNPGNKGKQVKLLGDLDAYFSQPGMRNTYGYWLDGEGIVPPVSFFEETFPSNLGSFTPYNILGDQEWVHATFDGGCAYMSGFYDGTSHPNEDWLISPAIDLSGRNNVNLQIRETINFLTSYADLKVLVSNNYTGGNPNENGTWTELSGFNRPPGNNWVFVDSGNIDLSSYDGQTIRIAFKYLSSSAGSSVWQVSRVILSEIY